MPLAQNNFYQIGEDTIRKIASMISCASLSIVEGGTLEQFEKKAAAFWGHSLGVATCNGTAAIHLALFAAGIQPGDQVIVPVYGFHGMVIPILQLGALPVFCDIYPDSLTINVEHAISLVSAKTKAVLVLHPWGNPAHMDKLRSFTSTYNLSLISDASHAHGATWQRKPLGAYCDILCASFGLGKLISGGELGIATTDDPGLRDRMLLYGHVNRVPNAYLTEHYRHLPNAIGIKYRPHAFALQLALDQMESYRDRCSRLLKNTNDLLQEMNASGLKTQRSFVEAGRVFWKVVIMAEPPLLDLLKAAAAAEGLSLEGNHYYPLLHKNPIFSSYYGLESSMFPSAESLNRKIAQIDALQLYDRAQLGKYIRLIRRLSHEASLQQANVS